MKLNHQPFPTEFPEQNVVFAKDQPQYLPLPAYRYEDGNAIVCCWKFSLTDRIKFLFTGKMWHNILLFNKPLQPQRLTVDKLAMP